MNDFLLLRSVLISVIIHLLAVSSIAYIGASLPEYTPPLIIDFLIENISDTGRPGNRNPEIPEPAEDGSPPQPPARKIASGEPATPEETKPDGINQAQTNRQPEISAPDTPVPEKIIPLRKKKRVDVAKEEIAPPVRPLPEVEPVRRSDEISRPVEKKGAAQDNPPLSANAPSTAGRAVAAFPPASPGMQAVSSAAGEPYLQANLASIREIIERNTGYPALARKMGWEGQVLVAFTVCTDGGVEGVRVVRSCGFKALDESAVKTVRKSVPFPCPPVKSELILPITYRLN